MAEFKIKIAGHTAAVRSLFESTRDYCGRYLSEDEPGVTLTVSPDDLIFEQAQYDQEALEEGFRRRKFTDPFLERTAIQRKLAEFLFDQGILMTHGSAIAVDGRGYLFTARSGTGKSTHTRLWREVFGDRAIAINDDKPFLDLSGKTILACGAPWSGKHGLDTNITVPLAGICILERGSEDKIFRVKTEEALPMLLHQSYRPLSPDREDTFRQLVETLATKTPLWRMECTRDPGAARVAFDAMSNP